MIGSPQEGREGRETLHVALLEFWCGGSDEAIADIWVALGTYSGRSEEGGGGEIEFYPGRNCPGSRAACLTSDNLWKNSDMPDKRGENV